MPELYQLPGRRGARQAIWRLAGLAIAAAAVLASAAATQWLAWRRLAVDQEPLCDLRPFQSAGLILALLLAAGWALGLWRGRRGPLWWGWLLLALLAGTAPRLPLYRPDGIWRAWLLARAGLEAGQAQAIRTAIAVGLAVFVALALWILRCSTVALRRVPRRGHAHGSAHFATAAEVRRSPFLSATEGGVILGSFSGRPLRCTADSHVLLFAPPGSGKSTVFAVPTLLSWQDSVLVLDTKGELYDLTSGYRAERLGQSVSRLDYTADLATQGPLARHNPLLSIPRGDGEVAEAQAVAQILVSGDGQHGSASFWASRAKEFLVSLILHDLYSSPQPSLSSCRHRLRSVATPVLLAEMMLTRHDPKAPWTGQDGRPTATHPEIAGTAQDFLHMAEETRSGILAHVADALSDFADPRLAANTAVNDIRIGDLMDRDRPVSLYVTLPAGEVERLERVLRLLISQWLRELLLRKVGVYRHRLLLLLDEFPILGKLDFLEKAGALLRGYGAQLFVIVQSVTQLKAIYGPHQTLSEICPIHLTLGATDEATASQISRRLGQVTVATERQSVSTSGSRGSISEAEHARPLLGVDEVAGLPGDKLLLLSLGDPPILGDRVPYFKSPDLMARVSHGALDPSRLTRFQHPSSWTRHHAQLPDLETLQAYLEKARPAAAGAPARMRSAASPSPSSRDW